MFFNNLANWLFALGKYTDHPYALGNILLKIFFIFHGKNFWLYKILHIFMMGIMFFFLPWALFVIVPLGILAFLEQYFTGRDSRGFDTFGKHMNGTYFDDEGYDVKGFDKEGNFKKFNKLN